MTTYAEYAAKYSTGMLKTPVMPNQNKEYVMVVSYVSPGPCYPISRKTNYPNQGGTVTRGKPESFCKFYSDTHKGGIPHAFVKGAASQYAIINETIGFQAVNLLSKTGHEKLSWDYDELAVSNTARLLPAFLVYFKRQRRA